MNYLFYNLIFIILETFLDFFMYICAFIVVIFTI